MEQAFLEFGCLLTEYRSVHGLSLIHILGTFHISSDSTMTQNFVVTGTQGALKLGDPNMFNAELQVTRPGAQPPVNLKYRPQHCCFTSTRRTRNH